MKGRDRATKETLTGRPLLGSAAIHVLALGFCLLWGGGPPGPAPPAAVEVFLAAGGPGGHSEEKLSPGDPGRGAGRSIEHPPVRGPEPVVPDRAPAPEVARGEKIRPDAAAGAFPPASPPPPSPAPAREASPAPFAERDVPGEAGPKMPGSSSSGAVGPGNADPPAGRPGAGSGGVPGTGNLAASMRGLAGSGSAGDGGGAPGGGGSLLREAIQARIVYPEEARRRGLEGEVLLRIRIERGGYPGTIRIARSSGARILDEAAQRGVVRAAPLPSAPGWVEVPVRFFLR